jgi:hypothetical protein
MKSDMPFQGEMMTCAICGKQKQSSPSIESNWNAIFINGELKYLCPSDFDHMPELFATIKPNGFGGQP